MDIKRELRSNTILLSVLSKLWYKQNVLGLLKDLSGKKICYITLNKTADSLEHDMKSKKLPTDHIFFIDTVSRGIDRQEERDNTLYISSPAALTELSLAINEVIKTGAFDLIFFDSLSTLNIYDLGKSTERFTTSIMNKIKAGKRKGLFTCLEDDMETSLVKTSCIYVDKVVRYNPKRTLPAAAVGALILGVLCLPGLSLFASSGSLTGYSVAASFTIGNPMVYFVGAITASSAFALAALGLFLYKTFGKVVPAEKLVLIKPAKYNQPLMSQKFRKKIRRWVRQSVKGLF